MRLLMLSLLLSVAPLTAGLAADAGEAEPSCPEQSELHTLDFWLGDWRVMADETHVGDNSISRDLGGCVITEYWRSTAGGEGRSVFYLDPQSRRLKQLWITSRALAPGGTKEKRLIEVTADGSVVFGGRWTSDDGELVLDRTLLTPRADGSVRQRIEWSTDGGDTWHTSFDAVYYRLDTVER